MGEITFRFAEPPLTEGEARRVAEFTGRFLREEHLHSILLGKFAGQAQFVAGMGYAGEALAGTCWAGWGEGFPDIAVMGGVATREADRGRGVATGLVGGACERFEAAGGRLLFLGTTNPAARRIYERLGFRPIAARPQGAKAEANVFCRAAPGADPDEGFAPGLKAAARPASWRDMAAVAPLYLRPHPCVLADAVAALPSSRVVAPWRCVRIFWDLWKSVEQGGRWSVLQNESGWVVASAIARLNPPGGGISIKPGGTDETRAEARAEARAKARATYAGARPGGFSVDFLWHPDYSVEAARFVAEWAEEVEAATDRACEMLVCEGDEWKMSEARKLGFEAAAGAGGVVDVGGMRVRLLRMVRSAR